MSSLDDYNQLLIEVLAIKPESIVVPNMPVDVFVQEAENLYHWCIDDQAKLTQVGLSPTLVNALPVRAGACREAQSRWIKERNMRKEAEQQWKDQAPEAFDLRNQLVHAFRFAFRKHEGLSARVEEIAQGDTNSDMVQDLNDLSVLGKANLDLVTVVGITEAMLENAANMADRMGDLLGATNGERQTDSEAMIIRDQAFTLLKQAVDDIRDCGKFVFWRNPDRLKGYTSDYWQHKNMSKPAEPVAQA